MEKSLNFYTALVGVLIAFITFFLPEANINASEFVGAVQSKDITYFILLVMNVAVPLYKIFKNGGWSWKSLTSPNFISQVIVSVASALVLYAGVDENLIATVIATIQGSNIGFHIQDDIKNK